MDGFFVAKLLVGKPKKGSSKEAIPTEAGKQKVDTDAMNVDNDITFDEEEDKPYLEGERGYPAPSKCCF